MKSAEQGNESAIKKQERRTTPSFIPKPFECATCYRPHDPSEHKLRPCNRCHRVYYCGRECQMKHFGRGRQMDPSRDAIRKQNKNIVTKTKQTKKNNNSQFLDPDFFSAFSAVQSQNQGTTFIFFNFIHHFISSPSSFVLI